MHVRTRVPETSTTEDVNVLRAGVVGLYLCGGGSIFCKYPQGHAGRAPKCACHDGRVALAAAGAPSLRLRSDQCVHACSPAGRGECRRDEYEYAGGCASRDNFDERQCGCRCQCGRRLGSPIMRRRHCHAVSAGRRSVRLAEQPRRLADAQFPQLCVGWGRLLLAVVCPGHVFV